MKIGLYQSLPTDGNIEQGFSKVKNSLEVAAKFSVDMVVFPELFLPGYNRPDLHKKLAQSISGNWITQLSHLCKESGCGLTLGWAERCGEKVYNSAVCLDQQGSILAHYRKIQLFGDMEKQSFSQGEAYKTFYWHGKKAALLICYDIEFPQHCRALARQGVTLIFVPTANPCGYEQVSRVLVPARAVEMSVTIVYANYCGTEKGLKYAGLSIIVGADSIPFVRAGSTEAFLIADMNAMDSACPHSTQISDYLEVKSNAN